jgi:hypothetical protein
MLCFEKSEITLKSARVEKHLRKLRGNNYYLGDL